MKPTLRVASVILSLCVAAMAQSPASPSGEVKTVYNSVKNFVLRSAEKMPEDHYSFQPTPEVRTFAGLLGHIADANYTFCSAAKGEARPEIRVEKTKTTKADLVPALKEMIAYCDGAYNALTDANAGEALKFRNRERTRSGLLNFNIAHTYEHYGNLVTYLRMKGIVPPSSER